MYEIYRNAIARAEVSEQSGRFRVQPHQRRQLGFTAQDSSTRLSSAGGNLDLSQACDHSTTQLELVRTCTAFLAPN